MPVFHGVARLKRAIAPMCLHISLALATVAVMSLQPAHSAAAAGETRSTWRNWSEEVSRFAEEYPVVPAVEAQHEPAPVIEEAYVPEPVAAIPALTPVQAEWVNGYRDGGGLEEYLPVSLCIIEKESTWRPTAVNRVGPFYGLGQFIMSTWHMVGGGDWTDPYTQGRNFARNWNRANPATEWPRAYAMCNSAGA